MENHALGQIVNLRDKPPKVKYNFIVDEIIRLLNRWYIVVKVKRRNFSCDDYRQKSYHSILTFVTIISIKIRLSDTFEGDQVARNTMFHC